MDPSLIFTFLFGSDRFEDIIGRLQLVTQTLVGGSPEAEKFGRKEMVELERRRVVRLAVALRDRIQTFVDGNEEAARAPRRAPWSSTLVRLHRLVVVVYLIAFNH